MGSTNALPQNNASVYNIGRRNVIASGEYHSRSESTVATTPVYARSSAGLGTTPDIDIAQRSTLQIVPRQKVTQSNDEVLVSNKGARYIPTAAIEEEIANKDISKRGAVNTGVRIVVREDGKDELIHRTGTG